jgi:very-short-patch-repair endonuclease
MLLDVQRGIARHGQAVDAGMSAQAIQWRLSSGKWRRLHHGVYATFTGEAPREAVLRAALLRAGPGAMLSHETAAEIQGLSDKSGSRIHVTVSAQRNPARRHKMPGVVIHRSSKRQAEPRPDWQLPRTTVEDTVLDVIAAARTFDDAYAWISRAVGRQLTTVECLRDALAARKKFRWRTWLTEALADAAEGIHFPLERRYVHDVERAHGLPRARRQARRRRKTGVRYLDNLYDEYRVCVELDGGATHPPEQRWQDIRRDSENLAEDDTATLRFGFPDVTGHRCERAAELAAVLRRRGWEGSTLRPCRRGCLVGRAPLRGPGVSGPR